MSLNELDGLDVGYVIFFTLVMAMNMSNCSPCEQEKFMNVMDQFTFVS